MDWNLIKQQTDLAQVAIQYFGYQLIKQKSSQRQWVLSHPHDKDTLIVTKGRNGKHDWYFNPQVDTDKGTVVDLVLNRNGKDWDATRQFFSQTPINSPPYSQPTAPPPPATPDFTSLLLPLTDAKFLKQRHIFPSTLSAPLFKNRIFNWQSGTYLNTAFPLYRGKSIVGVNLYNHSFKGYAPGSKKGEGCWFSDPKALGTSPKNLLITESPLDALSIFQIANIPSTVYLSTGGTLSTQQMGWIRMLTESLGPKRIIFSCDKDLAGMRFNVQLLLILNPVLSRLQGSISAISPSQSRLSLHFSDSHEDSRLRDTWKFALQSPYVTPTLPPLSDPYLYEAIIEHSVANWTTVWDALNELSLEPRRWMLLLPKHKDWNEDLMAGG